MPHERLRGDVIDRRLATEVEIIRSVAIARRAAQLVAGSDQPRSLLALKTELEVKRRGAAMVLEISISDAEPRQAVGLCHAVVASYVSARLWPRIAAALGLEQGLDAQIERLHEGAAQSRPPPQPMPR